MGFTKFVFGSESPVEIASEIFIINSSPYALSIVNIIPANVKKEIDITTNINGKICLLTTIKN